MSGRPEGGPCACVCRGVLRGFDGHSFMVTRTNIYFSLTAPFRDTTLLSGDSASHRVTHLLVSLRATHGPRVLASALSSDAPGGHPGVDIRPRYKTRHTRRPITPRGLNTNQDKDDVRLIKSFPLGLYPLCH